MQDIQLQFITHFTEQYDYMDSARIALEGGCRWVQLRMKDASDEEIIANAAELRKLCDRYGAKMLLDDKVHLIKTTHADGVHLGKNDMPVSQAREILGKDIIIGGTANTFEDIKMHYEAGADYIGCGPFRFTETKKKLSPVLGTEGYRHIVEQLRQAGIEIPIVAIGGIELEDIDSILETGIPGIAVSGAVLRAEDPAGMMKAYREKISKHSRNN